MDLPNVNPGDLVKAADINKISSGLKNLEESILKHAAQHRAGGSDPITPASIGAYPAQVNYLTSANNLNTLTTPGTYMLSSSVGVTTANGYPLDNWAGWVEVQYINALTLQKAYSLFSSGGGSTAGNVWVRAQVGGQWGAWLRLDNTGLTPASIGAASATHTHDVIRRDLLPLLDSSIWDTTLARNGLNYFDVWYEPATRRVSVTFVLRVGESRIDQSKSQTLTLLNPFNAIGLPQQAYTTLGTAVVGMTHHADVNTYNSYNILEVRAFNATGVWSTTADRTVRGSATWLTAIIPSTLPGNPL